MYMCIYITLYIHINYVHVYVHLFSYFCILYSSKSTKWSS